LMLRDDSTADYIVCSIKTNYVLIQSHFHFVISHWECSRLVLSFSSQFFCFLIMAMFSLPLFYFRLIQKVVLFRWQKDT